MKVIRAFSVFQPTNLKLTNPVSNYLLEQLRKRAITFDRLIIYILNCHCGITKNILVFWRCILAVGSVTELSCMLSLFVGCRVPRLSASLWACLRCPTMRLDRWVSVGHPVSVCPLGNNVMIKPLVCLLLDVNGNTRAMVDGHIPGSVIKMNRL